MELTAILVMAFGFGLLHALDADHLLAVSGLSGVRREELKDGYRFSLRWALGHGCSILLVGSLVLFMGIAVPAGLSAIAEDMVAFMLLAIGLMLLIGCYRQKQTRRAQLRGKQLSHKLGEYRMNPLHHHRHGTVVVGLIHGLAGSAPLLALLPLSQLGSPIAGMAYLFLFCAAVLLSMLAFGGLLGSVFDGLQKINVRWLERLRLLLGLLTSVFGLHLMVGA